MIVVSGRPDGVHPLGRTLLQPGTVLVAHDLKLLREGVVTRTVTTVDREQLSMLTLEHGCVSCTLRGSLLPLLRTLSDRSSVDRIVLLLGPALEPAEVCEAIDEVTVTGVPGRIDAPAGQDVRVTATLTAIDAATWLADATGDDTVAERLDLDADDRTVAQVAVAQVEFADAVVVLGDPDPLDRAVLAAVLDRLAPTAQQHWTVDTADAGAILAGLPERSGRIRRGFDPHAPLLAGSPPLHVDAGVSLVEFTADRPFHPERLHEAVDVLLDGVVTARGRVWLATKPDHVVWLESAGAGLRIGPAGTWLAAMADDEQGEEDPERRAMAALQWHPLFGDRHTSLVVLTHRTDPTDIDHALQWALVTDEELRQPGIWQSWTDPFGQWHEDPCQSTEPASTATPTEGESSS